MKIKNIKVIELDDWKNFVEKTYGIVYNFQQQDFCKGRCLCSITIPGPSEYFKANTIPEIVNGSVSFKAWLERDPNQKLNTIDEWEREYGLTLFWQRNFFPDIQMVANDLHKKGLIKTGEYSINVDW